jgi:hypothetical protein
MANRLSIVSNSFSRLRPLILISPSKVASPVTLRLGCDVPHVLAELTLYVIGDEYVEYSDAVDDIVIVLVPVLFVKSTEYG